MHTPPASHPESPAPSRSDSRWLLLFGGCMILAGGVIWLAYPPAVRSFKTWQIQRRLAPLEEHLDKQQWAAAAGVLHEARKLAPGDPAVLRASLDFLVRRGKHGDPRGTISLVQRLLQIGQATSADIALLGKMHLMLGERTKAQEAHDLLSEAGRRTRQGRELLADLLQLQGEHQRAATVRREALKEHRDDPEALRQLAVLDLQDSSAERRDAMRARLWELARATGPNRPVAVDLLAQTGRLTVPQAEELRAIMAHNPGEDALRLRVISAQMRLSPHLRENLLNAEIQTWKNRPPAQSRTLIAWLAAEREHPRILRLVPPALAAKFTDLLPFYVDALRHGGQWQELATFLTSGKIDPAFPSSQKLIWRTEAQAKLDADPARARQMLGRLIEEAGRGENFSLTVRTAELAERLGQWDLAQRYFGFAGAKHALSRPLMLAKVYEMADLQHDGAAMLTACTELAALTPDNPTVLRQKLYLQALLGMELETAPSRMRQLAKPASTKDTDLQLLITALLAYRRGEMQDINETLAQITDPSALPVGARAVCAGLLKLSGGDPAVVFRMLEKLPPGLLIPEERKFAQRAW